MVEEIAANDAHDPDRAIRQSPSRDALVDPGSAVVVTFPEGRGTIPTDVHLLSLAQARARILNAGFLTVTADGVPSGYISCTPGVITGGGERLFRVRDDERIYSGDVVDRTDPIHIAPDPLYTCVETGN